MQHKKAEIVECLRTTIHNAEWADKDYTTCDVGFLKSVLDVLSAPARPLTAADYDGNPDIDDAGFLPCWVECDDVERSNAVGHGIIKPGETIDGWSEARREEMPGGSNYNPHVRLWTSKPTRKQMEETPWTR